MTEHWFPAYIGLGSNLGQPVEQLRKALAALSNHAQIQLISVSSFYQTRPIGDVQQDDFINAAACVLTTLSAQELLKTLLQIELEQGRERILRWGPRTLDLDLLVYSNQTSDNEFLCLPHPEMSNRAFVMVPLAEIAADVLIPELGRVSTILDHVDKSSIKEIQRQLYAE